MDKHEYLSLFEKHLAGKTSREEEQLLRDHQDDFELTDLPWDDNTMGDKAKVKEMLYQSLHHKINPIKRIDYKSWSVAATIILLCSVGLYFINSQKQTTNDLAGSAKRIVKPIIPGGNKAVLTLSDGSTVVLSNTVTVDPITDGVATISNNTKGLLVYNSTSAPSAAKDINEFNTISTPRGGQYEVILPDGTNVWLNASSSLSFPTRFSGKDRRVQLTGEAYFEVAKNARMPFKVDVKGMEVKVLGTHFNVMAYDDEQTVNTTLVEGAVEISKGSQVRAIKPGQQARFKKSDGSIDIENVNTAEFIAWKNGNFMFTDENIEIIMRKLARWYDVDVHYKGNLSDKVFAGYISKYEDVSEVLKMLELTETIHFKVEGRRITVMP